MITLRCDEPGCIDERRPFYSKCETHIRALLDSRIPQAKPVEAVRRFERRAPAP